MTDTNAERKEARQAESPKGPVPSAVVEGDRSERAMARAFAIGLPVVTLAGSVGVAFAASLGPAILVLTGGMLLGVVGLLWASLRTLSGEVPVPGDLVEASALVRAVDDRAERKRRALRALKDLEHEHAVGKLDDTDFQLLSAEIRGQAKELMREMDGALAPLRQKAEDLARRHLAKKGLAEGAAEATDPPPPAVEAKASTDGLACGACATKNEADARFCKACGAKLEATGATA